MCIIVLVDVLVCMNMPRLQVAVCGMSGLVILHNALKGVRSITYRLREECATHRVSVRMWSADALRSTESKFELSKVMVCTVPTS